MKNCFKYLLLLLIISFLIASLCRSKKVRELYTTYPFQEDSKKYDIKVLTSALSKYNNLIFDTEKAGSIDFKTDQIINEIKEEHKQSRQKQLYSPLKDNESFNYVPYESILPDTFKRRRIAPKIKGKKEIMKPKIYINEKEKNEAIKEKDIHGDFYVQENACIGEWTPWITDFCKNESDRCGIKYKMYHIEQPEKNNEKGAGKPCEYKDGEIRYRYCFGDDLDSSESNIERCNIPINVCQCKLNEYTSINLDGEKVYDLIDIGCNFFNKQSCTCPSGYTYLTKEDSEDDEGKCEKNKCICQNGHPVEGEGCLINGLELCDTTKPCNAGHYYEGNPPKCRKQLGITPHCSCINGNSGKTADLCKTDQVNKIVQFCASTCPEGYEFIPNSGTDTRPLENARCNEIYSEMNGYENYTCCKKSFDTCILNEDILKENNIERKNSSLYGEYNEKTISELFEIYQSESIGDEVLQGVSPSPGILDKSNPKEFLIQQIIEKNNTDDSICIGNISLDKAEILSVQL